MERDDKTLENINAGVIAPFYSSASYQSIGIKFQSQTIPLILRASSEFRRTRNYVERILGLSRQETESRNRDFHSIYLI